MKKNQRSIRFLELRLDHGTDAKHKQQWDLRAMALDAANNNYYARAPREGAARSVRIRHSALFDYSDQPFLAILLVLADAEGVNATYENIQTGEAKTFEKGIDEGNRSEAHLVVALTPEMKGTKQIYAAALEECPGLTPSQIYPRMQTAIAGAGKRSQEVQGVVYEWRPIFEIDGLMSRSLLTEISSGRLQSFSLVREFDQNNGLDEPKSLSRRRLELQLEIQEQPEGKVEKVLELLRGAKKIAGEDQFDSMRIVYQQQGDKRPKSATIDLEKEDVDDDAFEKFISRTRTLKLDEPMHHNHTEVQIDFCKLLAKKLIDEKTGE
ncbi:hypothetical protein [Chiayiivirga flava]|uniref:Uncharacterized protein n=1 Tax=Chiayiivirga flava TaxID=659595 RepID=A0A7W8D5J9_9GAMM|nr:hypothetical protein [Chiayiivirga flava]MBB5208318.1 hypothetical protein [Chiayiivirga flava]